LPPIRVAADDGTRFPWFAPLPLNGKDTASVKAQANSLRSRLAEILVNQYSPTTPHLGDEPKQHHKRAEVENEGTPEVPTGSGQNEHACSKEGCAEQYNGRAIPLASRILKDCPPVEDNNDTADSDQHRRD
jgi:hypothetical protein